jgi:type II secretory pathway pseudopilin PulG
LNEETTLYKSAPSARTRRSRIAGFSLTELAVSVAVLMILTAIAIPSLMRSFRTYQLNDAAARLADMLKSTRFEAVRRNTQVNFLIRPSGTDWIIGIDSNGNTIIDAGEKQEVIAGFVTLLPSGVAPSPAAITTALCLVASACPATTLTTLSGASNSVAFDARGAVSPLAADVLYLGSAANPEFGYRAVILLPSGATQIWIATAGGTWQRLS